jgi:hypothetical protein
MAGKGKRKIEAIGYMRTSSATNVGRDKDSEVRQRTAIESHAKAAGYVIVDWFYDPAPRARRRSEAAAGREGEADLRKIAARLGEQGFVGVSGRPYESVRSMLLG